MSLPRILTRPAALAAATVTLSAAVVIGLTIAGTADATPALASHSSEYGPGPSTSSTPISPDAPYDTPAQNARWAHLPKVAPARGTDHGHLPRWKHFADGRVLLREDRVDLRQFPPPNRPGRYQYTNVNPLIRSYWLDPAVTITVSRANYVRMTGRQPSQTADRGRVTRQQFLDSFNTKSRRYDPFLRYAAVYKITFDRSHTHIRRIDEVFISYAD
jgi:hypothetical protein